MPTTKKLLCILFTIVLLLGLLPASSIAITSKASRQAQDVSGVLNATMAELTTTVIAPEFGTNAGEWTVFGLARGNYYTKDNAYFTDYYDRIVATVNETAAQVNLSGALDKNKSTDNSRLIVALSAIGKDATSVGNWNLVEAYSANGIRWIRKQGINGTIWTLIALDSNNYKTSDTTIRQQCVDLIVSSQHNDGGWSLVTNKVQTSNVDITGMALTALYPYREQPEVAAACEKAIAWLSDAQLATGGFPYGTGETSESCAWAIVAATTWGINPDTDSRFIKNGKSAIDNLLSYYVENDKMFAHQGTTSNAMATNQATYALIAYNRLVNNKTALFDYSDVSGEAEDVVALPPTAALSLPQQVADEVGRTFKGVITLDRWDNLAGYKLIDFVMTVPQGLGVTGVTAGSRLSGGEVSYHLDKGKLRVVYFDAANHSDITVSNNQTGDAYPAQFFTVTFCVEQTGISEEFSVRIDGMSLKCNSDSNDDSAMTVVNTQNAIGTVKMVKGLSYSAVCLYTGDDIDLIPSTKKAVAVYVSGITNTPKLTYTDGSNEYVFKYSQEISQKADVATYVALVDSTIAMEQFVDKQNFVLGDENVAQITFGDANNDGTINAQDALAAVDSWLRKGDAPTGDTVLSMNVNGDSRINTFDALGIVEKFINGSEYGIVSKAATITSNS